MKVETKLNPNKLWEQTLNPVVFIEKIGVSSRMRTKNSVYFLFEKRKESWIGLGTKNRSVIEQDINSENNSVARQYNFGEA